MAVLQANSTGPEVEALQKALVAQGYFVGAIDGVFGLHTLAAVVYFQSVNGLALDGVVGPKTLELLGIGDHAGAVEMTLPAPERGVHVLSIVGKLLQVTPGLRRNSAITCTSDISPPSGSKYSAPTGAPLRVDVDTRTDGLRIRFRGEAAVPLRRSRTIRRVRSGSIADPHDDAAHCAPCREIGERGGYFVECNASRDGRPIAPADE